MLLGWRTVGRERGQALEGDDGQEDGVNRNEHDREERDLWSAIGIALPTLPARPEPHQSATVACARPSIIGNSAFNLKNLQSASEKPLALILSAKVILSWERVVTIFPT